MPFPKPLTPAKAGAQIHPERQAGFTWIPAFAGTSGGGAYATSRGPTGLGRFSLRQRTSSSVPGKGGR